MVRITREVVKNYILKVCVLMVIAVTLSPFSANSAFAEEAVTISSASEFSNFASRVNAGEISLSATLAADIDLEGAAFSVGTTDAPYTGTFDGAGHEITGFVQSPSTGNYGLFVANAGTIKDFTIEGSIDLSALSGTGVRNIGVVAAQNSGTISEIKNKVKITCAASTQATRVGGIAGINSDGATIEKCINYADLTVYQIAGGIAGQNEGKIEQCANKGAITFTRSSGSARVGGIAGSSAAETSHIAYCYNTGSLNINSSAVDMIGGIAGDASNSTIQACYNAGSISNLIAQSNQFGLISASIPASTSANYALEASQVSSNTNAYNGEVVNSDVLNSDETVATLNFEGRRIYRADASDEATVNGGFPIFIWEADVAYSTNVTTQFTSSTDETKADGGSVTVSVNGASFVADESAPTVEFEANVGDVLKIEATPSSDHYLAQVRYSTDGLVYEAIEAGEDGKFSLAVPDKSELSIIADFVSIVWDGTVDVTWYKGKGNASSYNIAYPAQFEGAAVLVNGLFNTYPVAEKVQDGKTYYVPDTDAFNKALNVVSHEETVDGKAVTVIDGSSRYGVFSATYNVYDSQEEVDDTESDSYYALHENITNTMRVIGDATYLQATRHAGVGGGSNNQTTTTDYWDGVDDFNATTLFITQDLDFGATKTSEGLWDTSSQLYMSLGGQYTVIPQNPYSKLSSSFNGVLDGQGHSFKNVYGERYNAGTNFGDCQSNGIVGRLGCHDGDSATLLAVNPTVRCVVFDSGLISTRRSVGAIVGKVGKTSSSGTTEDGKTLTGDSSKGGVIEQCINRAEVHGTDAKGCGGIVGAGWNGGIVRYCANFGYVRHIKYGTCPTGGIVGSNELKIVNCYNVGEIWNDFEKFSEAIGSNNSGAPTVTNCYYREGSSRDGGYFANGLTDSDGKGGNLGAVSFTAGRLTASQLNGSGSAIWVDDSTGINSYDGLSYPVLWFQSASISTETTYTLTLEQPIEGGTFNAVAPDGTTSKSSLTLHYGDVVTFTLDCADGWKGKNYILDGDEATFDYDELVIDGDHTISVKMIEMTKGTISFTKDISNKVGTKVAELKVLRTGHKLNDDGSVVTVKEESIESDAIIFEDDVLDISIEFSSYMTGEEGKEYAGTYGIYGRVRDATTSNYYTFYRNGDKKNSVNYTVLTNAKSINLYVDNLVTGAASWENHYDADWYYNNKEADTYTLTTPEELAGFAYLLNNGACNFKDRTILLGNDISLAKSEDNTTRLWIPIGKNKGSADTSAYVFQGTFDGQGHTVTGMLCNQNSGTTYAGLFATAYDAKICNVNVSGEFELVQYSGGVCASAMKTTFDNCTSNVKITGTASQAGYACGGVVGYVGMQSADNKSHTPCTISNCEFAGEIDVQDVRHVGGIVGLDDWGSSIEGCKNSGSISCSYPDSRIKNNDNSVGGIIGTAYATQVTKCLNTGTLTGNLSNTKESGFISGIAGTTYSQSGGDYQLCSVSECVNRGEVNAGSFGAAGIIFNASGDVNVSYCYNNATIANNTDAQTRVPSGILGQVAVAGTNGKTIVSCYNAGSVNAGGNYSGGLLYGSIAVSDNLTSKNCEALKQGNLKLYGYKSGVSSITENDLGSKVDSETLKASLSLLNSSGETSVYYADTEDINNGYPVLRWELSEEPQPNPEPDPEPETKYFTVSFNANGGTLSGEATQTVEEGKTAVKPADAIRSGYSFNGWSTSANGTTAFNFDTPITADITLYAIWQKNETPTPTPQPTYFTVTFNTQGGSAVAAQKVESGKTVTKPTDPTQSGYTFKAWTTDSAGKNTYNFSSAVTSNLTLYAQWTKNATPAPDTKVEAIPMYRLYNPNSGEHFYTSDTKERANVLAAGWSDEKIGWYAPKTSKTPVYRLYNPYGGEHHYTTSLSEKNSLVKIGWNDEGIGWYSDDSQAVALYRQYNPNAFANNHNYTTSKQENDWLVSLGWKAEGIGWYGVKH